MKQKAEIIASATKHAYMVLSLHNVATSLQAVSMTTNYINADWCLYKDNQLCQ